MKLISFRLRSVEPRSLPLHPQPYLLPSQRMWRSLRCRRCCSSSGRCLCDCKESRSGSCLLVFFSFVSRPCLLHTSSDIQSARDARTRSASLVKWCGTIVSGLLELFSSEAWETRLILLPRHLHRVYRLQLRGLPQATAERTKPRRSALLRDGCSGEMEEMPEGELEQTRRLRSLVFSSV